MRYAIVDATDAEVLGVTRAATPAEVLELLTRRPVRCAELDPDETPVGLYEVDDDVRPGWRWPASRGGFVAPVAVGDDAAVLGRV